MPATSRRFATLLLICAAFLIFAYIGIPSKASTNSLSASSKANLVKDSLSGSSSQLQVSDSTLHGSAIAPKLGNETAKAELGRATWKYFHTVFARFPDEPTADEREALRAWVHLFQRLYPCGECASHFGEILAKFPPQVSSRSAAAVWGCHVHNEVNKSLNKDVFDCSKIGDFYDCGCAEDEEDGKGGGGKSKAGVEGRGNGLDESRDASAWEKPEMSAADIEMLTGVNGRDFNPELMHKEMEGIGLALEKDRRTRSG